MLLKNKLVSISKSSLNFQYFQHFKNKDNKIRLFSNITNSTRKKTIADTVALSPTVSEFNKRFFLNSRILISNSISKPSSSISIYSTTTSFLINTNTTDRSWSRNRSIMTVSDSQSEKEYTELEKEFLASKQWAHWRQGPTLIFDGVCNLCNGAMHWYQNRLKPDKEKEVKFMWVQHPETTWLMKEHNITDIMESWVYVENGIFYRGSTAWLMWCRHLNLPWNCFPIFMIVPEIIREFVYKLVWKNRYRVFGETNQCQRPSKKMQQMFIHDIKSVTTLSIDGGGGAKKQITDTNSFKEKDK